MQRRVKCSTATGIGQQAESLAGYRPFDVRDCLEAAKTVRSGAKVAAIKPLTILAGHTDRIWSAIFDSPILTTSDGYTVRGVTQRIGRGR